MSNRIPDGATTSIKDIKPGMMVKVKGDPVLHKCRSNDVYCEDDNVDVWGLILAHEPRMESYDDSFQGYGDYASYDFAHVNSIEYALPPIPPQYIAVAAKHGEIKLIEVNDQ